MVYILFISLFLHSPSHIADVNRTHYDKDISIISEQLESYIIDYDDGNIDSAWLIYNYIKENNEYIPLISELANKTKNHSSFYNTVKCSNDSNDDFIIGFLHCVNEPSIILSYLHDNYNEQLIDLLSKYDLTEKEKFHLNYIKNNSQSNSYPLDTKPHFLDIYYFDNILNDPNYFPNDIIDDWKNVISNYSSDDLYQANSITSFFTTIFALYNTNREAEIIEYSSKIDNPEQLPIITLSHRVLRFISFSAFSNGYYHYDISFNRKVLIPFTTFFSKEEETRARLDFGVSLYQFGNIHASLDELEKAYLNIDHVDDRTKSAILNNLGIVYYYTGLFEDYIQLILEALDYAKETNSQDLVIQYLNNLHVYYKKLENWNIAYEYLNRVHEKALEYGDKRNLILAYRSFATFHRDSENDIEKTIYYLKKAYDLALETDEHQLPSTILAEIIATHISKKHYDKAIEYTNKLYLNAIAIDYERYILFSHVKFADIYYRKGDHHTSTEHVDSMLQYNEQNLTKRGRAQYAVALSRKYFIESNNSRAFNTLELFADEIISRTKHSSELQSGHLNLVNDFRNLFEYLISKLIEHDKYDKALYWMEEVKNLSSASFYNNPALKSSILDENELVLDFALRNRIERLRSEIRTADDDQRVQLNNMLLEAISQQNSLRRKVLQNIDLEPADLRRIKRQLGASDAILYFSKYNNYLFATTISSGTFEMQKIEFSKADISRVDDLVHSLSSDKVKLTELQWLKEKIIDEMDISDRFTNYYIIPDGFLYHIPFEIFPVGQLDNDYSYGKTTYLIEKASISYANSLKDLERSFDHTPSRGHEYDFLGFGISHFNKSKSQIMPGRTLPPLPLAEREVTDIATLLDQLSRNAYHLSNDGTEQNFRNYAGQSRILHLASHSEVYENDPLYSLIYLNPDDNPENTNSKESGNSEDGLIYAYELFEMDLSNEMIMLNSCESGSGNYIQGSGIVGFSRAFNYAGVKSLVMNLWTIRDRPAYDMSVSFYSYLNEGYTKSEAMQKAKIDYINYVNSNPSYWGSFVIYGNNESIIPSRNPWVIAFAVLLIGILSLLLAWARFPIKLKALLFR